MAGTILAVERVYNFNGWPQATVVLFVSSEHTASARAVSGPDPTDEFVVAYGMDLIITQARIAFPHLDAILQLAGLDYLWV